MKNLGHISVALLHSWDTGRQNQIRCEEPEESERSMTTIIESEARGGGRAKADLVPTRKSILMSIVRTDLADRSLENYRWLSHLFEKMGFKPDPAGNVRPRRGGSMGYPPVD